MGLPYKLGIKTERRAFLLIYVTYLLLIFFLDAGPSQAEYAIVSKVALHLAFGVPYETLGKTRNIVAPVDAC